nr:MAG TPA: hypothetical protein [Caudoviricetes sp.]
MLIIEQHQFSTDQINENFPLKIPFAKRLKV